MDPYTKSRTEAENKAFKEASVEVDLYSSSWFERQTKRFPNKTPQQSTSRYIDRIGRKFKQLPSTIHMHPTEVTMAAEMEDLSVTGLHCSQDFPGIGSTRSRIESTSVTEKKPEEEDLVLSTEKGSAKGAVFSEEIARQGSFDPIDDRLMEESSNEQMLKQATEVEEELQIWLEKITNGDEVLSLHTEEMETVKVSSQGTEGMEMEEPEVVTQIRGGKNALKDLTTVTVGKRRTEEPGPFTTRKKNIWSEEEHRFD